MYDRCSLIVYRKILVGLMLNVDFDSTIITLQNSFEFFFVNGKENSEINKFGFEKNKKEFEK